MAACPDDPAPAPTSVPVAVEPAVVETAVPADPAPAPTDEPVVEETVEETAVTETDITVVDEEGNTDIDQAALADTLAASPVGELNEAEIAALIFMREEEKLAHDVYVTLYEQWGTPIFQNISSSEQTHTDAVLTLIERFGLEDPVGANDVGVFTDTDLQALYDQFSNSNYGIFFEGGGLRYAK